MLQVGVDHGDRVAPGQLGNRRPPPSQVPSAVRRAGARRRPRARRQGSRPPAARAPPGSRRRCRRRTRPRRGCLAAPRRGAPPGRRRCRLRCEWAPPPTGGAQGDAPARPRCLRLPRRTEAVVPIRPKFSGPLAPTLARKPISLEQGGRRYPAGRCPPLTQVRTGAPTWRGVTLSARCGGPSSVSLRPSSWLPARVKPPRAERSRSRVPVAPPQIRRRWFRPG